MKKVKAVKNALKLSEALYLAKEAGFTTTHEIQKIILSAPRLSTDKSPFLISNFYKNPFREILQSPQPQQPQRLDSESEGCVENKTLPCHDREKNLDTDTTNISINTCISQLLQPHLLNTFKHNGRLWLKRAEGRGTCKRAVASAVIIRGTGKILVNGKEEIYYRWPLFYNRMDVIEPFYLSGCAGLYDLFIRLGGGGPSGQSKAARLAIARALVNACPECYNDLQTVDMLVEDVRQRMPKMPGRVGARAQRRWVKR